MGKKSVNSTTLFIAIIVMLGGSFGAIPVFIYGHYIWGTVLIILAIGSVIIIDKV